MKAPRFQVTPSKDGVPRIDVKVTYRVSLDDLASVVCAKIGRQTDNIFTSLRAFTKSKQSVINLYREEIELCDSAQCDWKSHWFCTEMSADTLEELARAAVVSLFPDLRREDIANG